MSPRRRMNDEYVVVAIRRGFVFRISYFVSRISYIIFRISYFVYHISYFVSRISYLVFRISYFVSRISYFYRLSYFHIGRTCHVSREASHRRSRTFPHFISYFISRISYLFQHFFLQCSLFIILIIFASNFKACPTGY